MKQRSIQLSLLLICIALSCSSCKRPTSETNPQQTADRHIERAESYRQQGQYRAAIIEARNAIDAAPHNVRSLIELATLFNDLNLGKQALRILEPIADSDDRAVVIARADALLIQHKYHSALEYLLAHGSDDVEVRLRIAKAQANLGQTVVAKAALIALQNSSQATPARLLLAQLYSQQDDDVRAEAILKNILQENPNQIDALVLNAKRAETHGNIEGAEELLSRALLNLPQADVITPQKATVLQQLIPILTKLGRSNESLIYAQALADSNPQIAALQSKLKEGVEAFKVGKLDEAENLLQEVYDETHDESAGILLGMIKYDKKDYAGAATYLGENIDPEIAPDAALKVFANSQLHLGQPAKLLELISPEERENIKDPEMQALIGIALVQSGHRESGERTLTATLRKHPENSAVRATLARHYLVSGQAEKAISILAQGLAQSPADNGLQRLLVGSYLAAGQTAAALETARKLALEKPQRAENYYVYAHVALVAQHYELCASELQKALSIQPDYALALLDQARLYLIKKQPQPAAAIYRQLLAADGENVTALKGFITTQEMQNRAVDGKAIETAVLQLADNDIARAVMAEYYLRNQRHEDASRLLAAVSIAPGDGYPATVKQLYALATASSLLRENHFDKARQAALEGLRFNPRNADLLALLGHIEIRAGSSVEAQKIIVQLAQIQPSSPALEELRGMLALANNKTAEGIEQFRRLWANHKTDQTANRLYRALTKSDPTAAALFLNEWEAALPDSDSPLLLKAVTMQRVGNPIEARRYYEAALARNNNNALALNNLALLYADSDNSKALTLAEKAYSLQRTNPAIMDTYGWLLVKSRQVDKGLAILGEAAAVAPNSAEIDKHLEAAKRIRVEKHISP